MTASRKLPGTGMSLLVLGLFLGAQAPHATETGDLRPAGDRLAALPLTAVAITDSFWAPRLEVNRTRTLGHVLQQIEATGGLRNFDIAAGKTTGKFGGPFWADSDVYKWIEGASRTLAVHADPTLEATVDGIIDRIAAAQQKDGYLDTFIQINVPELRFKNFAFFHEDFSSGHLFEAAAAHYEATGKKTFLHVATRLADLFDREFGPGKTEYIPGHEGIEMALVKLYRVTGEKRYLDLARAMVDRRGQKPSIFERQFRQLDADRTVDFLGRPLRIGEWYERFYMKDPRKFDTRYAQDHLPVREQKEAVGHAVRAMFLYCAMADLVNETSDAGLWEASKALHDSVTLRRMYVTGGIGPSEHNEGFTEDYDLPNENAYQETCASAAMVLWNHRLFNLTGDARYTDLMELSLYNAVAAGVSLTGDLFCYVTPLVSRGEFKRSPWFGVPCCPTTIARFLPSLGQVHLQPIRRRPLGESVHCEPGQDTGRFRSGHPQTDHELSMGGQCEDCGRARFAAPIHAARPVAGLGLESRHSRERLARVAPGLTRLRRDSTRMEARRRRRARPADGGGTLDSPPQSPPGAGQGRAAARTAGLFLRTSGQPGSAARGRLVAGCRLQNRIRSQSRGRRDQGDDRGSRGQDARMGPPALSARGRVEAEDRAAHGRSVRYLGEPGNGRDDRLG